MNKRTAALILVVSLILVGAIARAAGKLEQEAPPIAQQWLALVDTGKYPQSWDQTATSFKDAVSKRKWRSTIAEIRKPLGKLVSRKLKSAEYSKELPGAPEGEYVLLKFDAAFEKKAAAIETVTTILGQDLIWRVSGYSVK